MPEKFSLRFADYFEGLDPGEFGLSADAAFHLVIFCQRIQRSDDFELGRCGKAQPLPGREWPAAMIEFTSRRLRCRLLASVDPGQMFRLRYQWITGWHRCRPCGARVRARRYRTVPSCIWLVHRRKANSRASPPCENAAQNGAAYRCTGPRSS
jgi:hypothetical protein